MNYLENIPVEAQKAFLMIQELLTESLVAVYLHGSSVVGGLRPCSDIDLFVVIDQPMMPEIRACLSVKLMKISGRYPFDPEGRRPLELMIFLHSDLIASLYPVRSEFIYGEWLRQQYELGIVPESVCDPEFTLILAQARQEAIPLFGPNANSLIPAISRFTIHQAIADALPTLLDTLQGDERNVLLTLARMWQTLATGMFVSKDTAVDWVLSRLPDKQALILLKAKDLYLNGGEENWLSHQDELYLTVNSLHEHILEHL